MNILMIPAQYFTEFYVVIVKIEFLIIKMSLYQQTFLGKWESVPFIIWL